MCTYISVSVCFCASVCVSVGVLCMTVWVYMQCVVAVCGGMDSVINVYTAWNDVSFGHRLTVNVNKMAH